MKDRGKELEAFNNGEISFLENNFSSSSDLFCQKHPSCSSVGICAICLADRLVELVCPECGEQRLSSCSCSEISSNPNSNPEVASVGRISFLLENDQKGGNGSNGNTTNLLKQHPKNGSNMPMDFAFLKRSNSSCVAVDVNTRRGFWRIGKLFKKKNREKGCANRDRNGDGGGNYADNSKSEMCVSDIVGVSRSRSLCSFRGNNGGGFLYNYDSEENGNGGCGGGVVLSAARASSVSGGFMNMDSAKRSCFSESEARISNFDCEKDLAPKGFFAMREINNSCEFSCGDDPKFIDLKLDLSSSSSSFEPRAEHSVMKKGGCGSGGSGGFLSSKEYGFGSMRGGGNLLGSSEYVGGHFGNFKNGGGGSSRFSNVSEGEIKKCRKKHKVWRWFFFKASSKFGK